MAMSRCNKVDEIKDQRPPITVGGMKRADAPSEKMRATFLFILFTAMFSVGANAAERNTFICKVTNWIQISSDGNLKNIERPEAGLFSFVVENSKLNFVSDDMTKNTLEVVYLSPAPEFRATANVGVQGVESVYYRKGLVNKVL